MANKFKLINGVFARFESGVYVKYKAGDVVWLSAEEIARFAPGRLEQVSSAPKAARPLELKRVVAGPKKAK